MADNTPVVVHNFDPMDTKDTIIAALNSSLAYQSSITNLQAGLEEAQNVIFIDSNPYFRNSHSVLIVITDGQESQSVVGVAAAAALLANQGVHIIALGSSVRGDVGIRALNALVASPKDLFYASGSPSAVGMALASAAVCPPIPTTTQAPPVLCRAGSSNACDCGNNCQMCEITASSSKCAVCNDTYANYNGACVPTCPAGFSEVRTVNASNVCSFNTPDLDVAFLVDSSGSISPAVYSSIKSYVIKVIELLPVDSADVR